VAAELVGHAVVDVLQPGVGVLAKDMAQRGTTCGR
jgi:hypothetical protein